MGKVLGSVGRCASRSKLSSNVWQIPHEEEFLIESYIQLIREIGRFPTVRELKLKRRSDPKFSSRGPFSRLGSKSCAAARIIEFCRARDGYDDVIKICEPFAAKPAPRIEPKADAEPEFGFVYLLKSGRHYKIGRSNAAGRREYELRLQLPEKSTKVHEIRTDGPSGHRSILAQQIAAKRRGGEWFDLDASDVNAFKQRKVM